MTAQTDIDNREMGEDVVVLCLSGPMMAFGAPMIDNYNRVSDFPGIAMLTGLIANALGWHHRDHEKLNLLQSNLRYAALRDRAGEEIIDYQTVDLSQDHMTGTGWVTHDRGAGSSGKGTHIRYRHYKVNARCFVALTIPPHKGLPSMDDVEKALKHPARPLFLGRKTCLPSSRIFHMRIQGKNLVDVLKSIDRETGDELLPSDSLPVVMVCDESLAAHLRFPQARISVDGRDWKHQHHIGERQVWVGVLQ